MEFKSLNLKIEKKEEELKERTFEGYASVFNIVDLQGDVVLPGAFKRSIQMRVPAGKVKLVNSHRSQDGIQAILGKVIEAREDEKGLWVKCYVSNCAAGDELLTKIREGVITELSIGYEVIDSYYDTLDDVPVRFLKEVKLYEVSPVAWAANEMATIDAASVKSVTPFTDFPLAPEDRRWDAQEAVYRCRKWASDDGSGDKDKMDWKKYSKCFFWYDADNMENLTSYKLPYVDIINDKAYAVPRAIIAAAAAIQGARGGVDIPEADKEKVKKVIEAWYKKMGREAPWKGMIFLNHALKVFSTKEGRVLSKRNLEEIKRAIEILQDLVAQAEADSPEKALSERAKVATIKAKLLKIKGGMK